jgi:Fusaric acid resistance protein-like
VSAAPPTDEAPRLSFGFAIRNGMGVAILLAAGVLADDVPAGAVAGGGALIVGFADVGDTRRHRAAAMLATAVLGATSTAVGDLVSDSEVAALFATGLWGLGTGLLVAGGPITGVVGLSATVGLIVFAGSTTGAHAPVELGAYALAGGVFQSAIALLLPTRSGYPVHPHPLSFLRRSIAAAVSWSDPIGRHAVRLGLALSAATAIYRVLPVDRGYWIPITVLFVMRPEAGRTRTRILQRFLGTVLGLLVLTLLVSLFEPGDLALALICAACTVPAYAYLWIDYTRFNAGLAGAVVALAAMLGLPEPIAALNRLVDTIVGLGLIALFLALLPETPRARREPAVAKG